MKQFRKSKLRPLQLQVEPTKQVVQGAGGRDVYELPAYGVVSSPRARQAQGVMELFINGFDDLSSAGQPRAYASKLAAAFFWAQVSSWVR